MDKDTLLNDLKNLLPDLYLGRESHVEWRDATDSRYDENIDCGDREFHAEHVLIYDKRIATVKRAIDFIKCHK